MPLGLAAYLSPREILGKFPSLWCPLFLQSKSEIERYSISVPVGPATKCLGVDSGDASVAW